MIEKGKIEISNNKLLDNTSDSAKQLLEKLLELNMDERISSFEALQHQWVNDSNDAFCVRNNTRKLKTQKLYAIINKNFIKSNNDCLHRNRSRTFEVRK